MPRVHGPIQVVDLSPQRESVYLHCLEERCGADQAAAGDLKARWYARMREQGLRVKLALDDDGRVSGMIQSVPIERAPAIGRELEFILCIWVHAALDARGDLQGRGTGTALVEAAEEDARGRGVKGMAAWGLALPLWMRASWFRRHGYRRADRRGMLSLVWKPFVEGAITPRWLPRGSVHPSPAADKVVVTGCLNGWCPAQNLAFERARRAAARFGDRVEWRTVDTTDRATMLAWGECDAIFVDGRRVGHGPPPTEDALARAIGRRLRRRTRSLSHSSLGG